MNQYFNFEIYLKDPISQCTGWEIKNVSVQGNSKILAKNNLKLIPNFDCIILYNFEHKENENCFYMFTVNYPEFSIVQRFLQLDANGKAMSSPEL
jgi:hypothetical protein